MSRNIGSSESDADDISFDTELKYGDLKVDAVIHFGGRAAEIATRDSGSHEEASQGRNARAGRRTC